MTGGSLTSSDFSILYEGRGPESCVDYTVDNAAAAGAPNCPVVQSIGGTLSQNVSGPVAESAGSRSFTAGGSATECPENVLFAAPPGPVRSLAIDVSTPLQATLTFQPPTDDGGSPIRWYEVSTDGGSTWSVITNGPDGAGNVSHIVPSLAAGSQTFDVRATNLLGTGTATDVTGSVVSTTTTTTEPTTTTTEEATTTTTEATTTTVVPVPDGNGNLPELEPGDTGVTDDGEAVEVAVNVIDDSEIEILSNDGVVLRVAGDCGDPCQVVTGSNGKPHLVMEDTGQVRVFGEGFLPGSPVHVWIFSASTHLGSATVAPDGTFDKLLDVSVDPGEHTLQVNGTTVSGAARSANLGLIVNAGSGSGQLANTGANTWYAYLGFSLLAAGVATIGVVRLLGARVANREEQSAA